jgi:hypothetical protein
MTITDRTLKLIFSQKEMKRIDEGSKGQINFKACNYSGRRFHFVGGG